MNNLFHISNGLLVFIELTSCRLKSSLQKLCDRHYELVILWNSASQMIVDIFLV